MPAPILTPLTPEQSDLLAKNSKAIEILTGHSVRCVRTRFYRPTDSDIDIARDRTLTMCIIAARHWQPDRGCTFLSYATNLQRKELSKIYSLISLERKRSKLHYRIAQFREQERKSSVAPNLVSKINLGNLSAIQYKVLGFRYGLFGKSYSLEKVAERLGVTRHYVRNVEIKALQKLGALKSS
jgi:hypothetical protein